MSTNQQQGSRLKAQGARLAQCLASCDVHSHSPVQTLPSPTYVLLGQLATQLMPCISPLQMLQLTAVQLWHPAPYVAEHETQLLSALPTPLQFVWKKEPTSQDEAHAASANSKQQTANRANRVSKANQLTATGVVRSGRATSTSASSSQQQQQQQQHANNRIIYQCKHCRRRYSC